MTPRRRLILPATLSLALAAWPGNAAGQTEATPLRESYRVIVERNIFLRDRRTATRPATTSTAPSPEAETPPPAPLAPEAEYLLVGVALDDQAVRAYVEHVPQGRLLAVGPGDAIAGGQIVQITLDAVEFAGDSGSLWIEIGHNFLGQPVAPRGNGGSASMPAGDPAAGSNLSLEERLRLRRQQELNR